MLDKGYVARWSLFLLGLLGVPGAALGLAERADGRVAVDLLVARQARLHGRRLLPADTPLSDHAHSTDGARPLLCATTRAQFI